MWLDGEWSKPCFVLAKDGPDKWNNVLLDFPGVYRLVALTDQDLRKARVCKRLCGCDETGTLYVGQSSYLHGRVSLLVRSTDPSSSVQAYQKLPEVLVEMFPIAMLAVTWQRCENADLAWAREGTLLRNYVSKFGELPPLNAQRGAV